MEAAWQEGSRGLPRLCPSSILPPPNDERAGPKPQMARGCGSTAVSNDKVDEDVELREVKGDQSAEYQEGESSESESESEIEYDKRRIQLYAIYNNITSSGASSTQSSGASRSLIGEHRLFLEDWNRQLEASERKVERKQASCSSAKADLYQILGLFFVFQGVVLTAVAQTNQLTCANWYLPFLLSLIVFVAAFIASVQKLGEIAVLKEQHSIERALYSSLYNSIESLKEQGTDFDLEKGQPELQGAYAKPDSTGYGRLHSLFSSFRNLFSVWVVSYAGGVLFLLCAFSAITLFSVKKILCEKSPASTP